MPAADEHAWRRFLLILLGTAAAVCLLSYLLILYADPYQNVPFSPRLDRAPVATNQRFAYVAIARDGGFPAALFGTSTARMLRPEDLAATFGPPFANLSMNSATAFEQYRLFRLWRRSSSAPRTLLLGLDGVWCRRDEPLQRYTFRLFPEWMYDANPWNDLLYLLNDKALEQAVRQLEQVYGDREPKYRRDGFGDFLPPAEAWTLAKARRKIYADAPRERPPPDLSPAAAADPSRFPALPLLGRMLEAMPREALKVLFFVPYHVEAQRRMAARMTACKRAVMDLAAGRPNTHVLDFMFPGRITSADHNYWDRLHYRRPVAAEVVALMGRAVASGRAVEGAVRYLAGPASAAMGGRP